MNHRASRSVDPQRSEINKRNRAKWRGFTPEGLERLRAATLANQPWKYATGPKTLEGKARSARNGCYRQRGELSRREQQSDLTSVLTLIQEMTTARHSLM
jgi:hypothetical protein